MSVEHAVVGGGVAVDDAAHGEAADGVHEAVDAPVPPDDGVGHGDGAVERHEVGGERGGVMLARALGHVIFVAVDEDEARAGVRQRADDRAGEGAAGSGDDEDAIGERCHGRTIHRRRGAA